MALIFYIHIFKSLVTIWVKVFVVFCCFVFSWWYGLILRWPAYILLQTWLIMALFYTFFISITCHQATGVGNHVWKAPDLISVPPPLAQQPLCPTLILLFSSYFLFFPAPVSCHMPIKPNCGFGRALIRQFLGPDVPQGFNSGGMCVWPSSHVNDGYSSQILRAGHPRP